MEEAPEVKFERGVSFLEEEMRRPQITEEALVSSEIPVPRTVNGTGHTGPSRFCATSP